MLKVSARVWIADSEIEIHAIRSQGAGGQHINKVSSGIHLRFDIQHSSLPDFYKQRLLDSRDQRISKDGIIVIKAQEYRSREQNLQAARQRLLQMIQDVAVVQKTRRPTKPTRASKQKRMDSKSRRGKAKAMRGKVDY